MTTYDVNGDVIMVIHVPMARREQKPVYINDNLLDGTGKETIIALPPR